MSQILNLYKKRGETPLQRLNRFCLEYPGYQQEKLSYLGRLDPMAEGVLLVSVGEVDRDAYLSLSKTYLVNILFGAATDTYDVLGKVTDIATRTNHPRIESLPIIEYLATLPGERMQQYPPYSSKPVNGTPLFEHARNGDLPSPEEIPTHQITIYEASLKEMKTIKQPELLSYIVDSVSDVRGDFRQQEIIECWKEQLRPLYDFTFQIASVSFSVSSGTYVRSLASDCKEHFRTPTLALRIIRTKVGEFTIEESLQ